MAQISRQCFLFTEKGPEYSEPASRAQRDLGKAVLREVILVGLMESSRTCPFLGPRLAGHHHLSEEPSPGLQVTVTGWGVSWASPSPLATGPLPQDLQSPCELQTASGATFEVAVDRFKDRSTCSVRS